MSLEMTASLIHSANEDHGDAYGGSRFGHSCSGTFHAIPTRETLQLHGDTRSKISDADLSAIIMNGGPALQKPALRAPNFPWRCKELAGDSFSGKIADRAKVKENTEVFLAICPGNPVKTDLNSSITARPRPQWPARISSTIPC
jgi:hypothetical protein